MGNFKEDIAKVRLIVLDVDGVMTDGGITVTPEGEFIRKFHAKDGYALSYALRRGYEIAIITGGRGRSLEVRLNMLGVKHIYSNCMHKIEALHDLMQKVGVTPEEVLYMGDRTDATSWNAGMSRRCRHRSDRSITLCLAIQRWRGMCSGCGRTSHAGSRRLVQTR